MELHKHLGQDALFILSVEDAQELAKKKIGRELSEDEVYHVMRGVEAGFEDWEEVLEIAIEEAVGD